MTLRKFITLVASALLLLAFTCGLFTSMVYAADTITISFWSIFPEGDAKKDTMDSLLDEFMNENPDIRVEHLGISFYDYFGKLRTAQAGGTDPTLSFNDNASVQIRAKSGVIRSIDSYTEKYSTDLNEFRESDLEMYRYDSALYALPFSSDFRLLFYNKDHFRAAGLDPEHPPETVEELIEYAEKLDVWDGNSLQRVGFHPKLGNNQFYTNVWNKGGEFFTDDGMPNLLDPIVLAGMQEYVDLCNRYTARQFNGFLTLTQSTGLDPFISQLSSMEVSGDWLAWEIASYIEKYPDDPTYNFDWGVAPFPYEEGCRTSYGNGFTLEISSNASDREADAAYKLMAFLTSYETQLNWVEYFQYTPPNIKSLNTLLEDESLSETTRDIFEEAQYKRGPNVCEAVPEWWSYITPELDMAVAGKITVQEAMENAQQNLADKIISYNDGALTSPLDIGLICGIAALILFTVALYIFKRPNGKEG